MQRVGVGRLYWLNVQPVVVTIPSNALGPECPRGTHVPYATATRRLPRSESRLGSRPSPSLSHHSGTQSSSSAPTSGALGGNSPRARSHATLAAVASNPTASACRRACYHPDAVPVLLHTSMQRNEGLRGSCACQMEGETRRRLLHRQPAQQRRRS